ncbi:MAG: bifunctional phosphoribosylaminoimidazolecarboxamide formyltransferase/IMP cyclohydrolase [Spirochaetales bacterium]|nr:bifunctional phosphoribosylaminoimidazolecarboxamide formyltransferase/IMP cyclohydrolase [Spirochaetales bacterium]
MKKIQRALLSVSDKTNLLEFAGFLCEQGVEIISTGGTLRTLQEAGLAVRAVEDFTGFPEMLDGRVKTLHPRIHAGILALRESQEHMDTLHKHSLETIDLVCVNLYPFASAIRSDPENLANAIENIDIGGPALLRAAAKNYTGVVVTCNPERYQALMQNWAQGFSVEMRLELAREVFNHTAAYDAMIAGYLNLRAGDDFPETLTLSYNRVQTLRYGENPHQKAAYYRSDTDFPLRQLQGKELSFNNMLDFSAALRTALSLPGQGIAIIKHLNPCGAASHASLEAAFRTARSCDPVSAFGGVIGVAGSVDESLARAITENFVEGVIARDFSASALQVFQSKPQIRLLESSQEEARSLLEGGGFEMRRIWNGYLFQELDHPVSSEWKVVTARSPDEREWAALRFAWALVRNVKSNAIVFCGPDRSLGIGAGQMSRVDSTIVAVRKAQEAGLSLEKSAVASDAFFPFRDGLDQLARAGATAVIQPGGSVRDPEVIAAANEHGLAMVFTGVRHFLH